MPIVTNPRKTADDRAREDAGIARAYRLARKVAAGRVCGDCARYGGGCPLAAYAETAPACVQFAAKAQPGSGQGVRAGGGENGQRRANGAQRRAEGT